MGAIPFRVRTNNIPDPRLTDIDVKVANMDLLEPALQQARNVLMVTHKGIEDFNFRTQENQIENIDTQIRNARLSGGLIAAISLLVGGIGIMNIMLASINERIREIGILKAVGATGLAIFVQILVESLVIAILGALAGLAASYGLVHLLTVISPNQNSPVITPEAMLVAMLFSACVGIVAGLFPAFKGASSIRSRPCAGDPRGRRLPMQRNVAQYQRKPRAVTEGSSIRKADQ